VGEVDEFFPGNDAVCLLDLGFPGGCRGGPRYDANGEQHRRHAGMNNNHCSPPFSASLAFSLAWSGGRRNLAIEATVEILLEFELRQSGIQFDWPMNVRQHYGHNARDAK
jgi:hypothetical protein